MQKLQTHLMVLERHGLLELSKDDDHDYRFHHALSQDAAYTSMLRQDRQRVHKAVARALEQLYPEQSDTLAPVLGQHYAEAGDRCAARAWYIRAANGAADVYALPEAVTLYSRAYALTDKKIISSEDMADLVRRYGRTLELLSRYQEALALYHDLEQHAQARNDQQLLLSSLLQQTLVAISFNDARDEQRGQQLAQRTIKLAQALGDLDAQAKIEWCLLLKEGFRNHQGRAIRHGTRSLALARQSGNKEQLALTLSDLAAYGYFMVGYFDKAESALEEACGLWRELGDLPMLANALSAMVRVTGARGELERSLRYSEEAFAISAKANNLWGQATSLLMRAPIELNRGQLQEGVRSAEYCIKLSDQAGFHFASVINRAILALFWSQIGLFEYADALLRDAEEMGDSIPIMETWTRAVRARLELGRGDLAAAQRALDGTEAMTPEASLSATLIPFTVMARAQLLEKIGSWEQGLALLDKTLALIQHHGTLFAYVPVQIRRAKILVCMGRRDQALETVDQALRQAEAMQGRWHIWQLLDMRAEITGHLAERWQAQQILTELIGAVTDPELQHMLRSAPLVAQLLESS